MTRSAEICAVFDDEDDVAFRRQFSGPRVPEQVVGIDALPFVGTDADHFDLTHEPNAIGIEAFERKLLRFPAGDDSARRRADMLSSTTATLHSARAAIPSHQPARIPHRPRAVARAVDRQERSIRQSPRCGPMTTQRAPRPRGARRWRRRGGVRRERFVRANQAQASPAVTPLWSRHARGDGRERAHDAVHVFVFHDREHERQRCRLRTARGSPPVPPRRHGLWAASIRTRRRPARCSHSSRAGQSPR